ncbi:hypothetical protein KQX54_020733 [Cotesia glomerata]|uniref:Uncharacterized protein n=1 Tax=Cotesia glomerata TaxID=32391 RepID=A0AAV7II53_COTGL|nr:hypothetical protein KQX54_020733 [Cotesia glomerata]
MDDKLLDDELFSGPLTLMNSSYQSNAISNKKTEKGLVERASKIATTRGLDKPLGKIRAAKEVAWTGFIVRKPMRIIPEYQDRVGNYIDRYMYVLREREGGGDEELQCFKVQEADLLLFYPSGPSTPFSAFSLYFLGSLGDATPELCSSINSRRINVVRRRLDKIYKHLENLTSTELSYGIKL